MQITSGTTAYGNTYTNAHTNAHAAMHTKERSAATTAPADAHTEAGARAPGHSVIEQKVELQEAREIRKLKARDTEVRAHEQAHAAAGGVHAGGPQYDLTTGPNGVPYAIGGHVDIDISPVPGDPEATLEKMLTVQRAALAPASPSAQDRAVAAKAAAQATQARAEMLQAHSNEAQSGILGTLIDVLA